jgi:hypothetical protein
MPDFHWSMLLVVPIILAGMFVALCNRMSKSSGWRELAEHYRCRNAFSGRADRGVSLRMCSAKYDLSAIVGSNDEGLYLALIAPFCLYHPSLLIPWSELTVEWKQTAIVKVHYLDVRARKAPACPIQVYDRRLAQQIVESASQHA